MKKSAFIIICGFVTLLSGCSTMTNSDVAGTYKDNNPLGISTLVLEPDGTFRQNLVTKAGNKYTATGKWTFDNKENRIFIGNGLSFDDLATGKLRVERISMSLPVENLFGETQIIADGDRSIAFSKID